MDTAQLIAYIVGAGGGVSALVTFGRGIIKWLSGAAGREKARNTDLASQRVKAIIDRDEAFDARDEADRRRRVAFEYASRLRRQLYEAGITPEDWPVEKEAPAKTDTQDIPHPHRKE